MLSFKNIAEFLKKVGGTREDHGKDTHQKCSADGSHAGACRRGSASAVAASSAAAGCAGDGVHLRPYVGSSRAAFTSNAGAVVTSHYGEDAHDSRLSDFPTLGMPSTFGDNVMFASSHILRGLPPNTSMQDVLLHIRCVVQERSERLRKEEQEEKEQSSTVSQHGCSDGSTAAGESATAAGPQRRKSASFTSVTATSSAEARAAPCESGSPVASLKGKDDKGASGIAREHVKKLQKVRAEMIDALDLCLQEVPEDQHPWGSSNAGVCEDERVRNGKTGPETQKQQERSSATSDATAENSGDALPEGMKTDSELVVSRQELSTAATQLTAAELSPAIAHEVVAPAEFGHYEWRRLLIDIIDVLVRIDRALLHDARLRILERLVPPTPGSSGNAGPEFWWENLSQALVTPAALGAPFSAAEVTASGSRRTQLPLTPTRCPPRQPTHGDAAPISSPLPNQNADTAAFAAIATPCERAVTPVATTTTAARAGSTSSPLGKGKRTLVDSGVMSPDPPADLFITKEDKKMLEELLTIACSLASWAIVKAILRHHLHVLEQRQSRGILTSSTKAATTVTASVHLSTDIPASSASMETSGAVSTNITGRPPLAPPAPPPPAAMNDAACSSDTAEGGSSAAEPAVTDDDQTKSTNPIGAMDDVDAIPYIDWAAVVLELAEWIGEQHFVAIAECILCASFLRDDGREMVLCMLQTPKPRRLLTNIHRHADKLPRGDVDPLLCASSPPRVVTVATAPAGSPTVAATAFSGSAPATTSSTLTSSGSPSISSGSGSAAAAPPATGSSLTPSTIRAMLDDPTLVMDDLVARLEMVYRKAVANTWASYLEDAIEADVQQLSITAGNAVDAAGSPAAGDCETSPASTPATHLVAAGEDALKQTTGSVLSPPALPLLQQVQITDTKTLCRLATAFFFGSDAWSESKRERRFALLFRSMRGRMERYSESAATRRHLRRGTVCNAPITHTGASATVASSSDPHPLVEPPTAGVAAATTAPSSRGASQSQSLTIPPHIGAAGAPVASAAAALTPPKINVEGTSARPSPSGGCPSTMSNAAGVGIPTLANRGVTPSNQWAAHQLLSSNASTSAVSAHSTPLTTSLLVSRDGTNDMEGTVSGTGTHINGSGVFTVGHADRATAWTPFAFAITPSETMTPPPEPHHPSSSTANQRGSEDRHHEAGEDNVGKRAMESSTLSIPVVTLQGSTTAVQSAAPKGGDSALESLVLERIVNMSWSAALHKRGEQCLTAKPPRLEEAEKDALEERLVANAFGEFRARQRAIVSLINARLASGKSVEALTNAQKHFKFEKKNWTSHNQTVFSAMRYLQSMVFLVRAQAACRVYGAVIETVQFVLPQAALCEQMLQVLAPRPRGDCILRFGDCRSKLLRSYVYLLKEGWLAHAAFNDLAKAEKYFIRCAQVMQMLRRRVRETELFAAYMERGAQLMKLKEYKQSVALFRCAVSIAKKSLQAADAAVAASASSDGNAFSPNASVGSSGLSLGSAIPNIESTVSAAPAGLSAKVAPRASQQQFHCNLHLRAAGSGSLTTAEEHIPGATNAIEDDLELIWRVAESERMLALSYVTQAEHEVNVRERREELSNAVSSAYSSQRSLQRWQRKGGTPKRLLTAVPCSLIVICKGLLLLNQPRKAALLLEPLIENKPNSALVRPPMWGEILHPTEDPYTTEDVVLRTYVSSVKIAVFMLYARCLAEFDGDRALRAVTLVDQLLQESDAWICTIRTELRRALENVSAKDKNVAGSLNSPRMASSMDALGHTSATYPRGAAGQGPNSEDGEYGHSCGRHGYSAGAEASASPSTATTTVGKHTARTIKVPTLQMPASHSSTGSPSPPDDGGHSPGWNSPEEAPLRPQRLTTTGTSGAASAIAVDSTFVHDEPSPGGDGSGSGAVVDDDDRSRRSTSIQLSAAGGNRSGTDLFSLVNSVNAGVSSITAMPTAHSSHSPSFISPHVSQLPTIRVHTESSSECMTALFALREAKSHIRKALRGIFIVSGDAYSLIKNWEEALKVYSHALVITMSEVEAASAAAQSRRRGSHSSPQARFSSQQSSTSPVAADDGASLSAPHDLQETLGNNIGGDVSTSLQAWGTVVPLDEEFFLWDEEDVLISDNLINRELTASTAAKDLRAVVADEERMDSRACESVVLSKLANVYRSLEKPATAIHYHTLVMEYANECHDKLLAYNSMLSLARLYTAANMSDKARDAWAKVSELAKEYEDKEASRETMRNIVAAQEAAGMYMDVVKTAEELEKLANGEEGEDAARDSRFALEALANANLQLGQFDACIAALDSREKVQEKSAEWSGALLSMRAKARMGLNKSAEAIKVMQSWATKARNLANWVELGKANAALSAAYASENHNMQARSHHEATLNAFALAETLDEECRHIALESARWLVHYAYLDDTTVQIDPTLTYTGGGLTSDSEASGCDFHYADRGLCNISGDLGVMLAKEEELRRASSMLGENCKFGFNDDDDDFGGGLVSNQSMFGVRPPGVSLADAPSLKGHSVSKEEEQRDDYAAAHGEKDASEGTTSAPEDETPSMTSSFVSSCLGPKDSGVSTQPPSLASSVSISMRGTMAHLDGVLGGGNDHSEGSSSAGQSDGGDNEAGEDLEDEAPRSMDVEHVSEHHQDPKLPVSVGCEETSDMVNPKKPASKPSPAAQTPTVTTAAVKPNTNTATVAGSGATISKSASSTYVPPPTSLANVSICSRPAAAAAGTDVLELPVDASHTASEHATLSGPSTSSSPLLSSSPRGAILQGGTAVTASGGEDDGAQERKPSTVRTTYFRGAIEMIETAAQLLLVPRSMRHNAIPYSPAEAVDFALLAHPHSLFVFYFAEYTTEYGAQCDVVVRPPRTAGFMKLRVQISLQEYHNKDAMSALLASIPTEFSITGDHGNAAEAAGAAPSSTHPFGTAMARAATGSAAVSPPPSNATADSLRTALEEETSTCLRNLYADTWQPIADRMRREHVNYQGAETLIIMPDVALMHLPFAGLLPSPNYGDEEAPLGEQFTLIVTPSLTHFVHHGMSQQPQRSRNTSGALDPSAKKYIFIPYDSSVGSGSAAPSAPLAMPTFTLCAPSSSNIRAQQQSKTGAGTAANSTTSTLTATMGSVASKVSAHNAGAPPVSSVNSLADSSPTGHPLSTSVTMGNISVRSNPAPGDPTSTTPSTPQHSEREDTFDDLLCTWRVHRGCTRKELIQAFTDVHTRALMFLAPVDQGLIRVADGVVTIQDLMQNLQQVRLQQTAALATNVASNVVSPTGAAAATLNVASLATSGSPGATTIAASPITSGVSPVLPLPPLCSHIDLLVLTANRSHYPTVSDAGTSAKMCMELDVHRVLRLNILHGLAPNDEHHAFIALYLANLKKVMRWALKNPYAVALRTTIAEARSLGMSSNTWGAFTLIGVP